MVTARRLDAMGGMEAVGIEKRFGGIHALRGAHIAFAPGTVHGLLGQNGSGKSTLLRILSGQIQPDAGELRIDGRRVHFGNPARALSAGIAVVSQELTLAPDLSVQENILLARSVRHRLTPRRGRDARRRVAEVMDTLGLEVDPDTPVGELRADEQQLVEIGRAVSTDLRLLIVDEPTSSLSDDEVQHLFTLVRRLRDRGVAIVLVTHRTAEVFEVVDEATVLRDGHVVASGVSIDTVDTAQLVTMITGSEQAEVQRSRSADSGGEPVLSLRGLTVPRALDGIDLDVAPGEVVGVAGLMGSGRSELLAAAFGAIRASGEVVVRGQRLDRPSPWRSASLGLGYVPADRARAGLVLGMAIRDNVVLPATSRVGQLRRRRRRRERALVGAAMESFRIVPNEPSLSVSSLSGGNQQRVMLSAWIATEPQVLMLDEPTRGVDVEARADIHRLLLERARTDRIGMVVASTESSELRTLCDRVIVLRRGRVVAELDGEAATDAAILSSAMG